MDVSSVPPSSPPLLPHASTSHLDSSPFFESQTRAYSMKSSSPPPLFSSDDSRESVDITNYQSPRIFKNKRKGTWWDATHNSPEPKKTRMTRNFDSGIYMMSDATDSSEDPLPEHKSPFPLELEGTHDERDQPSLPIKDARTTVFKDRVRFGLDRNHETYDFQGLDLEDEDIQEISRIASVIKTVPDPGDKRPEEGQFRSMEPDIYINFTDNKLRRLTPKLFDLQHLTTLVLRGNAIEELPPQLAQLRNLKTLNVSLNRLESLPFEMLNLLEPYGSLERVQTLGNPLLEPMSPQRFLYNVLADVLPATWTGDFLPLDQLRDAGIVHLPMLYKRLDVSSDHIRDIWQIRYFESWANSSGSLDSSRKNAKNENLGFYEHHPSLKLTEASSNAPRYIARTPVSYFGQAGNLVEDSPAPPTASQAYAIIVDTSQGAFGVPTSWFQPSSRQAVSSLVTTCLQSALKSRHFDDLTIEDVRSMLADPIESIPHSVDAILNQAIANDTGGWGEFRKCHVCRRDYIVSRAEWIEFWSAGPVSFYPLKVKVCSWGCVPANIAKRPERELKF